MSLDPIMAPACMYQAITYATSQSAPSRLKICADSGSEKSVFETAPALAAAAPVLPLMDVRFGGSGDALSARDWTA